MLGTGSWKLIILFAATFGLAGLVRPVAADDSEEASFEVVDSDGIYFGTGKNPKTPGVLVADDVWKEIPEYKKILDDELTEDDPEYHLLMLKATERFNKALKALAKRDSHDMLGEVGSIKANSGAKIPDVTAEMIKLVTR
ncbi:MAG: hypothetical protein L6Q95_17120 [Planctomycetes bacterium]|nr:hypothetical protein [Planctomycetota bacterium]